MQEKGGKVGRICTELENTVGMKDEMFKGWKDGVGGDCVFVTKVWTRNWHAERKQQKEVVKYSE